MQMSKVSWRLLAAAAMAATVSCDTSNEGSASVKGGIGGKAMQAQSALFVSTAVHAAASGTTPLGDSNGTAAGDTNALLAPRTSTAGHSLTITIGNQSDVCAQASNSEQPANADYLVLSLVGGQGIPAGTYSIIGAAAADANTLLPGDLTPAAAKVASKQRTLLADTAAAADGNNVMPDGHAPTIASAGVVATASYVSLDAKCGVTPLGAKSGSVTLTQVDTTGSVEGAFDVTMVSGEVLTGTFKAQRCAPLMSSNAHPYSCN